jgi:glycosyltransferase involved in cell wall biosynthesis
MNWPYPYRLPLDFCRLVSSTVPLVIANSAAGLDFHVNELGFRPGRSMVIPNGIDTRRFRPDPSARRRVRAEWGLSPEKTLIGQVARLDPVKDIPTFLRSARMVAAERPDAMFAIVGGGRPDYRDELEAEADRLGIADRVIWAGHRTDASDAINAFDLACSSSAHGEGFNNGLAEALACGVPAAATAVGDSAVVVGEAGRVVRPGDPAALAAACLDLLGRDRTELSQRARRRVVERFSLETLHRRTETALVPLWDRIKDDDRSGPLWTRPLH